MELISHLVTLWSFYLGQGLPFLLAHAFVLLTIVWLWVWDIRPATADLRRWADGEDCSGVLAADLEQFRRDCESAGARGVLVPVTDLSARVNSYLDVLVDRLHSRVNLFLIVGVAGTFFAMFRFVLDATTREVPVSAALRDGLMQAFPIGFFGLVWTFLGHYVAFSLEEKLRNAANRASRRALELRRRYLRTVVDEVADALKPFREFQTIIPETLAPITKEFSQQLQRFVEFAGQQLRPLLSTIEVLQRSTEQLSGASQSLAAAAEAMLESLAEFVRLRRGAAAAVGRMADSAERMESALTQAAEQLRSASADVASLPQSLNEQLREGLESLTKTSAELWERSCGSFLETLRPVRVQLEEAAGALHQASAGLSQAGSEAITHLKEEISALHRVARDQLEVALGGLRDAGQNLSHTAHGLASAADALVTAFEKHSRSLADQSANVWRETAQKFLADISNRSALTLAHIRQTSDKVKSDLEAAAQQLRGVSQQVDQILKVAVREAGDQLLEYARPHFERALRALADHYPELLKNMEEAAQRSHEISAAVQRLREELDQAAATLKASAEDWDRAVEKLERLLTTPIVSKPGFEQEILRVAQSALTAAETVSRRVGDIDAYLRQRFPRDACAGFFKKIFRRRRP